MIQIQYFSHIILNTYNIYNDLDIPTNILKRLRIPDKFYMSALNQRVPLGGSAIFHTGRWMSMEMAEILGPLIVEFEKMPARERKILNKELAEKRKSVINQIISTCNQQIVHQ